MTTAFIALGPGAKTRIEINGMDVGPAVSGLHLDAKPGHAPAIRLDLTITETALVDGEARVYMRHETAELLQRCGWTPPTDVPPTVMDPASQG